MRYGIFASIDGWVAAFAAVGLLILAFISGILAWVLGNERRISSVETAVTELRNAVNAIHERMDAYFSGRERPRK